MADAAVQLAPGILRIPTFGDAINSFAFLEGDDSVTLIDCGVKRAPARIQRALASVGKHPRDVQRIILTHAHSDHAGGAAAVTQASSAEGVFVHQAEEAYISSGQRPPLDGSSGSGRIFARVNKGGFTPIPVAGMLQDGQVLSVAGGLQVIHTPGHTPGHISLLHQGSGVLITGDSIFNITSRMTWSLAAFCTDAAQSRQTAEKFADLDFTTAAFTHGPEIRDRGREAIRTFLTRKARGS
jgi:glyoxylase-like metal-dependent hydrolase (beta-lactamase superfamily II)